MNPYSVQWYLVQSSIFCLQEPWGFDMTVNVALISVLLDGSLDEGTAVHPVGVGCFRASGIGWLIPALQDLP